MRYLKFIPSFFLVSLLLIFFYKNFNLLGDERYYGHLLSNLLILVSLLVLSFIFIFITFKNKINLILVLFSIFFSLFLIEFYLVFKTAITDEKYYTYKDKTQTKENLENIEIAKNMGNRYKVLKEYRDNNVDIVSTIPPTIFLNKNLPFFPVSGISNTFTYFGNENGYNVFYESDKYGFFNDNTDWEKNIDYLIVGDSQAHGCCVRKKENLKGQIEKHSNYKLNALNLGYSGNGALLMYATLKEYISLINPNKVLWVYNEQNDKDDTVNETYNEILNKYLTDDMFSQNLINKNQQKDLFLRKFYEREYVNNSDKFRKNLEINVDEWGRTLSDKPSKLDYFRNLITLYNTRQIIKKTFFLDYDLKIFEKIIIKANNLVVKNNSELIFVYLPSIHRYSTNSHIKNINKSEEIIKLVKKNNIKIIDLTKEIEKEYEDPLNLFPFRKHVHFNKEGFDFIAKKILDLD